jgi:hypothetical protein
MNQPQNHNAGGRVSSIEESSNLTGTVTRDLPASCLSPLTPEAGTQQQGADVCGETHGTVAGNNCVRTTHTSKRRTLLPAVLPYL